jgi:hypothetical protein
MHTWDLARAARLPAALDEELCARGYTALRASEFRRDSAMFGPEVEIGEHASAADRLVAFYGRDPGWEP